jgi:site-specific recombinase XerD
MKDYYEQSIRALQLAGMSERTQKSYTRAVRLLVDFYQKTPDQIGEVELGEYFLHRKNTDKWSSSTLGISYAGIRFFFINVLKHDWHIFTFLKAKKEKKLPCIMEQEEVFAILDKVRTFHNYTFLSMVYACGPRISEALALQVSDIDGKRMMIHVHRGSISIYP